MDPISKAAIVKLIRELNQVLNMTTIIVSHDVSDVMQIADEIYIISNGEIIESGPPAKISQSQNPAIKQFIHGLADGEVPFHYPSCKTFQEELMEC